MKNTGFITPKITSDHYVMGAGNVNMQVLQPTGDWSDSLPITEKQSTPDFETCNCTGFGTTNLIEMYMFKRFGLKFNFSDRWVGIIAGTKPPGNDPHTVLEAIRQYGLIPEEMLPFSDDIKTAEDYFSFKGVDKEACYAEGKRWLQKYSLTHEWVFNPDDSLTDEERLHNMRVALKYSPLGIAVYAWQADDRGVYVDVFGPNHWTSEYGVDQFQKIFDSYDPFTKSVDQKIVFCKRINIEERAPSNSTTDIGSIIILWIKRLLTKLFS